MGFMLRETSFGYVEHVSGPGPVSPKEVRSPGIRLVSGARRGRIEKGTSVPAAA